MRFGFGRRAMPATGFYIDSGNELGAMNSLAAQIPDPKPLAVRLASRGDLTSFLMELTSEINADSYMLVAIVHDRDGNDARIIASNWIFDAIELAGHRLIAALAQSPLAVSPGIRPRSIVTSDAPALPDVLSAEEAKLLDVLGHCEIFALKLNVGRQRLYLMFSAAAAGSIKPSDLMRAQMQCCYALSQVPELLAAAALQDPLSDRERECLFWVSEGKTTDEVAVILGVSSNTVNSYITHAIQKFSAPNRAAAVATAIRSGII
jgi:DNA-binding CsgD family transcriptional regulator